MKTIQLRGKVYRVTLIDDEDYEWLSDYRWYFMPNNRSGYVARMNQTIYMHRMILDVSTEEIDHINGNGLDNQRSNLRICTSANNKHNRKFKGYFFDNQKSKWHVVINQKHGGFYTNEQDAIEVATQMKKEIYGEFANLEIPEQSPWKW